MGFAGRLDRCRKRNAEEDLAAVDIRNPARPTLRMGETAAGVFRDSRDVFTSMESQ